MCPRRDMCPRRSCDGAGSVLATTAGLAAAAAGDEVCSDGQWDVESLGCGRARSKHHVQQEQQQWQQQHEQGVDGSSNGSSRSSSGWGTRNGDLPHSPSSLIARSELCSPTVLPPSHVYLVFACKSLDELRLLGTELLDAAHGCVHMCLSV
jgi:hypothetical protein